MKKEDIVSNPKAELALSELSKDQLNERLIEAVEAEDKDLCSRILALGGDPNTKKEGDPLLFLLMMKSDNTELADVFIGHGADLEMRSESMQFYNNIPNFGQTPIIRAALLGRVKMLSLLIARGANFYARFARHNAQNLLVSFEGFDALLLASMYGRTDCVRALLDAGISANNVNVNNETALLYAASYGHIDCMRLLLDRGANPNIANAINATPLYCASLHGEVEAVRLLLQPKYKANLNTVCTFSSSTPLTVAATQGHLNIVEMLLKAGADVTCGHEVCKTALLGAGSMGHKEIVNKLMEEGYPDEQLGELCTGCITHYVDNTPYFLDFLMYLYQFGYAFRINIINRVLLLLDQIEDACNRMLDEAKLTLPEGEDLVDHALDRIEANYGRLRRIQLQQKFTERYKTKSANIRALFYTYIGRQLWPIRQMKPSAQSALFQAKELVFGRYSLILFTNRREIRSMLQHFCLTLYAACERAALPRLSKELIEMIVAQFLPTYNSNTGMMRICAPDEDGNLYMEEKIRLVAEGTSKDYQPKMCVYERLDSYSNACKGWKFPTLRRD